jgi:hypothetical protein
MSQKAVILILALCLCSLHIGACWSGFRTWILCYEFVLFLYKWHADSVHFKEFFTLLPNPLSRVTCSPDSGYRRLSPREWSGQRVKLTADLHYSFLVLMSDLSIHYDLFHMCHKLHTAACLNFSSVIAVFGSNWTNCCEIWYLSIF